jgi:hypothetical protein
MSPVDLLGYAALAAVLATFCMRTMTIAYCRNSQQLVFYRVRICRSPPARAAPHLLLLPVNSLRLVQFQRLPSDAGSSQQRLIHQKLPVLLDSVLCRTDCKLFELTQKKARELYFEDRSFSFAILQLIIQRLSENNERLQQSGSEAGAAAKAQ